MQANGPFRGLRQHDSTHSSRSSSGDSYDHHRMTSLSRSESGTSRTHYEDFANTPSPKVLMNRNSLDWDLANSPAQSPRRVAHAPDPVAMHLLVETAVGDSSQFEIMSIEELDDLKKEEASIARRIPSLRRELQLESKFRDAAMNAGRLDDHGSRPSQDEYAASVKKCDDLGNEVYQLERRQVELQDRRLKHTAGVLQMDYNQRTNQSEFQQYNRWQDTEDWADGFNLRGMAPGGIADTFDGIMDIPGGSDPRTDATLDNLWTVLHSQNHIIGQSNDANGSRSLGNDAEFSLDAFSNKVQNLCSRAADLHENQSALEAQLKQEREARTQITAQQLQDAEDKHLVAQKKFQDAQANLMEARGAHDQTKQEMAFLKQQHEAQHREISGELQQARAQVESREQTINHLQSSDSTSTARLAELTTALDASREKISRAEKLEEEHAELEAEVVRLQTEVTVARAELDGAYGTRAQRAAEVAANPEVRQELDELRVKNEQLRGELRELVSDHEGLTRQGIETERDREGFEKTIDELRNKVEALEVRVAEERVRQMGRGGSATSTPGGPSTPGGTNGAVAGADSTSLNVMRNEFKKLMRDTRAEHFRNMRAEQEERRKVEAMLRGMRKDGGVPPSPGALSTPPLPKSGLRQQTTA